MLAAQKALSDSREMQAPSSVASAYSQEVKIAASEALIYTGDSVSGASDTLACSHEVQIDAFWGMTDTSEGKAEASIGQ